MITSLSLRSNSKASHNLVVVISDHAFSHTQLLCILLVLRLAKRLKSFSWGGNAAMAPVEWRRRSQRHHQSGGPRRAKVFPINAHKGQSRAPNFPQNPGTRPPPMSELALQSGSREPSALAALT